MSVQPLPRPGASSAAVHGPPNLPAPHSLSSVPTRTRTRTRTRRINGLTHVNLTKLDVLSDLAEIKVGVAYRTPSGALLHTVPEDLDLLEQCEVR